MLAEVKKQLAALPPPDPKLASDTPEAVAREEKRRQFVNLLAEIEKRINEENAGRRNAISARPRGKRPTRFTTTACAAESKTAARRTSPRPAATSCTAS